MRDRRTSRYSTVTALSSGAIFDGNQLHAEIEMLATMVARLLEASPVETQEEVADSNSVVGSILGGSDTAETILAGMNPQHMIVTHASLLRKPPTPALVGSRCCESTSLQTAVSRTARFKLGAAGWGY